MSEQFDVEEYERLIKNLHKENFDSLSFDEQEELLDKFIEMSMNIEETQHAVMMVKADFKNHTNNISKLSDLVDEIGIEHVKEMFRASIEQGVFQEMKLPVDDIRNTKDIIKKIKSGEALSEEESDRLNAILQFSDINDKFTSYGMLMSHADRIGSEDGDKNFKVTKNFCPLMDFSFNYALGCLLSSDRDTTIKHVFDKHGYKKLDLLISDFTSDFTEEMVSYFEKKLIEPEMSVLIMLKALFILTEAMKLRIENIDDKNIKEYLNVLSKMIASSTIASDIDALKNKGIFSDEIKKLPDFEKELKQILRKENVSESDSKYAEEYDDLLNKASDEARKKLKKKDKIDIKNLLLDD